MTDHHPDAMGDGGNSALDMRDGRDRAAVRGGIARGWGISSELMAEFARGLSLAMQSSIEEQDVRGINSCVRTLAMIVRQVQDEEAQGDTGGSVEVTVRYASDAADRRLDDDDDDSAC